MKRLSRIILVGSSVITRSLNVEEETETEDIDVYLLMCEKIPDVMRCKSGKMGERLYLAGFEGGGARAKAV